MYTPQNVIGYVHEKLPEFFDKGAQLKASELSDGNINFVFRVEDPAAGKSLIIKHAEDTLRVNPARHIGFARSRIECEVLKLQRQYCPELIPEVYLYDAAEHNIVMEDMKGYENLRYELCEHKMFPNLAEDMAEFCGKALIGTTDMIVGAEKKKDLVDRYTNPKLCEITERHVLTEPYYEDLDDNGVTPENDEFMRTWIYGSEELHAKVGMLKALFETKSQALIHGDLHTGSIFVTPDKTCILDPEFAFYGPIGYDTGNFIANMIFAYANGLYTMEDGEDKETYLAWVLGVIEEFCDKFIEKAKQLMREKSTDRQMQSELFFDAYLTDIFKDQAGFAGTELIRRVVGTSGVRDIKGIEDEEAKAKAERLCMTAGMKFILEPETMASGRDYVEYLKTFRMVYDLND
ncbi:MAG: S-methyl-5-thioribose kinase [Firmicutes bacterium]|nr:S-methyl-5-thioribose kinase [Bacillota bacterium]